MFLLKIIILYIFYNIVYLFSIAQFNCFMGKYVIICKRKEIYEKGIIMETPNDKNESPKVDSPTDVSKDPSETSQQNHDSTKAESPSEEGPPVPEINNTELQTIPENQNFKNSKEKWYKSKILCGLLLIIFFPVGIFLLWKYHSKGKKALKVIVSIICGLWFLFLTVGIINSIAHPSPTKLYLQREDNPDQIAAITVNINETKNFKVTGQNESSNLSNVTIRISNINVLGGTFNSKEGLFKMNAKSSGTATIYAYYNDIKSNEILIKVIDPEALKKQAGEIDDRISKLGDITLDKADTISKLKADYDNLPDDARGYLKNSKILEDALNTINQKYKDAASEADSIISSIGNVTADSASTIQNARSKYDALPNESKKLVANYKTLTDAESSLKTINAESDFKASCSLIDYKDAARNPSKYKGANVKFTGKVIQVQGDVMRVNVTQGSYGIWSDTIYVNYLPRSSANRILEDDIITLYGTMEELKTYTTVMNSSMTIPQMTAKYIDIN